MIISNVAKTTIAGVWIDLFGNKGRYARLKTDTAMVFEEVLPQEVCAELVARIEGILNDPNHGRVWRDSVGSDNRILGFEKDIKDHIRYFNVHEEIKAIEKYLGRKIRSWFLMANRVSPESGNLGSGGGLHRDSPYSNQVKCIWYLNDVSSKNGPFQFLPGSHRALWANRRIYPLGRTRFNSVEGELIEVQAKAGSMLVCDTKCIHGGKPISSGNRYAVTLYTFTSENGAAETFRKSGLEVVDV